MPKRAPSPDLPKTSNLMVFWQPFPMNGNYEQPEHCKELFVWVASALGGYEHVLAIHHKPSARSMVLVEIDLRKKPDTLLAEHRWNEVLKNPCPEDENRVSRVYYSIYRTARDAQKDGWKCVHLDSSWFDDQSNEEFMEWAINEGPFVHPYPKTYWCKDLEEDSTNKRMARPLPRASVPPPVVAAPPVPGSLAYALAQANQAPAQPKSPRSKSKKAQHAADPDNWGPAIKNPYQSAGAAPTFSTAAKPTGGNSAWARGPPTSALSAKAGGSTPAWASSNGPAPATGTLSPAPSVWTKPSASIKTARSAGGPAAPPAFPPGVPAPPSLAKVNGKGKGKKGAGTVDALSQSVDTLAISPTVATPTQSTSWADMMDEEDDADFGPNMYQVADNAYNSQSDNEDEGPTFIPLDDDPGSDPEADFIAQFEHEVLGAPQTVPTSPSSQSVNPGSPVPEGFMGVGKGGRGRKKGSKGKSTTPSETDSNPTPLSIAAVGMTHSFKHENLGFTEDFSGIISRCPYHGTTCKKGICDWRKKDERTKERAAFDKKKREDKEARKKQRLQEEKEKLEKAKLKNGSGGSQSGSSENAQSDDNESDVSVDSGDGGPGGNGRGRGGWNRGRGRVRGNRGRERGNPAQAVRS